MDFTFGIITSGNADNFIYKIIDSIIKNNIPNYEIIIVGHTNIEETSKIKKIYFDENIKKGWITRKKNIIVNNAKYENIVLLHDYVTLTDGWYKGFLQFGNNFDFCITKIKNKDGNRFRDYTLFPYEVDYLNIFYSPGKEIDNYFNDNCLLPYHFKNNIKTNKYMYISGAYYIIKKNIALKYLLDESLIWGKGEDVEYSKRLHSNGVIIKCNHYSEVYLLKQKESVHWEKEINEEYLNKFITYYSKLN
jgi:hypothetical protein